MSSPFVAVTAFGAVYLAMALGRWPGLALDRTGAALIGAIALLVVGAASGEDVLRWIDFPTLGILFSLMVLSAQFAASGLFERIGQAIAQAALSPKAILAVTIAVSGALSAFLTNDVVVFALTPVLIEGLRARGLDPRPFVIALATAANAGSAATVIGNPQNLLIGETSGLDFWRFAAVCSVPALGALATAYCVIGWVYRASLSENGAGAPLRPEPAALDPFAAVKGLAGLVLVVLVFTLFEERAVLALGVAGALLLSRRLSTERMLSMVDWHLLVLFAGLFIVTGAFAETEYAAQVLSAAFGDAGSSDAWPMAILALFGSNTIGNVPLVVLALSLIPDLGEAGSYALALFSTLAGNLLIVGSMANIIMVERAKRHGVVIGFGDYARIGAPLTGISFMLAYGWLRLIGG